MHYDMWAPSAGCRYQCFLAGSLLVLIFRTEVLDLSRSMVTSIVPGCDQGHSGTMNPDVSVSIFPVQKGRRHFSPIVK